jgi:cytochrome b involved in lipid metabolism
MAINGKVYNVTAYLPFHPGGEKEMMRGVGRDGTKLFSTYFCLVQLMGSGVSCLG